MAAPLGCLGLDKLWGTLPVTGQEEGEAQRGPGVSISLLSLGRTAETRAECDGRQSLLSGESLVDSVPLKISSEKGGEEIKSWFRYPVGTGKEEFCGDAGVMQGPCLMRVGPV